MENIKLNLKNPENSFGPLNKEGTSITITGYAAEGTLLYPGVNSNKLWKYEVSFHDGDKPICEAKTFPADSESAMKMRKVISNQARQLCASGYSQTRNTIPFSWYCHRNLSIRIKLCLKGLEGWI